MVLENSRKVMTIDKQVSHGALDLTLCEGYDTFEHADKESIESLVNKGGPLKNARDHVKSQGENVVDIKINNSGTAVALNLDIDPSRKVMTKNRFFAFPHIINHKNKLGVISPLLSCIELGRLHKDLQASIGKVRAGFDLIPYYAILTNERKPAKSFLDFINNNDYTDAQI